VLVDRSRFDSGSGKLEALLPMLEESHEEGRKTLVFSQFTSFLALVRAELDDRKIPYEYLDGSTVDRAERVKHFAEDEGVSVFLLSLKAGGVGLNLQAAERVVLLDPWWNPAVEAQAIDRAHRIGQHRTVHALRFVSVGTVEERVLEMQARKRTLADAILGEDAGPLGSLTREDLEFLLRPVSANPVKDVSDSIAAQRESQRETERASQREAERESQRVAKVAAKLAAEESAASDGDAPPAPRLVAARKASPVAALPTPTAVALQVAPALSAASVPAAAHATPVKPMTSPTVAPPVTKAIANAPAPKVVAPKVLAKSVPATKAKPEVKSATKPTSKPTVKPASKPMLKPASKPASKPMLKPASKPASKPTPKPAPKPTPKPLAKVATKPASKSTAKAAAKSATKPSLIKGAAAAKSKAPTKTSAAAKARRGRA
jgi:hypothetical protein